MASIKHYGKRVAGYGVAILLRLVRLLRDSIRNRYPALYQELLKKPLTKRIYRDFVRPLIERRPVSAVQRPPKRDSASAKALQKSLIRAAARWQLGKRMDD